MVNKDEYRKTSVSVFLFRFPCSRKWKAFSVFVFHPQFQENENRKAKRCYFLFFLFFCFPGNKKCKTFSFFQLKFSIFRKMEHVLHFPETENIFPHTTPTSYLDRQLLISVFHANFMALWNWWSVCLVGMTADTVIRIPEVWTYTCIIYWGHLYPLTMHYHVQCGHNIT